MARLYDDYIHTDQVLWCIREEQLLEPLPGRYVHEIEADPRDVVVVLDEFVWEHIIGKSSYIPPEDHAQLRNSLCELPYGEFLVEIKRLEDAYIAEHLPKDLWGSLMVDDFAAKLVTFLLRWPFQYSSIVSVHENIEKMRT